MSLIALHEPITLGNVADIIDAQLDARHRTAIISSIATLDQADNTSLCYMHAKPLLDQLKVTTAVAVIVTPLFAKYCFAIALIVENPRLAWSKISRELIPRQHSHLAVQQKNNSLPLPIVAIDSSASIGKSVHLGNFCTVAQNAVIGDRSIIASGVAIGEGVHIGNDCYIGANVVIYRETLIGSSCTIHSGAIIGSDGFGYEPDEARSWNKISQLAGVRIGNEVEIGANSAIDCGALVPTTIGNGVKIDNLVHIGHGSQIGDKTLICASVTIAGSTKIGTRCIISGMVGISDNITIADDTTIKGMSTVTSSCTEPGQTLSGILPARAGQHWTKWIAKLNKLIK